MANRLGAYLQQVRRWYSHSASLSTATCSTQTSSVPISEEPRTLSRLGGSGKYWSQLRTLKPLL